MTVEVLCDQTSIDPAALVKVTETEIDLPISLVAILYEEPVPNGVGLQPTGRLLPVERLKDVSDAGHE